MSFKVEHRSVYVPEFWSGDPGEHARKIATAVNQVLKGHTNNHYTVTLEPDETETVIPYESSRPGIAVVMTPRTASAAAAMASGSVYADSFRGEVKIFHDADPSDDRTFFVVLIG